MARANDGTGQAGKYVPKHCLVQFGSSTSPGVVLGWRHADNGQWEANVMYAHGGGNVEITVYVQWLPAPHVRPLER